MSQIQNYRPKICSYFMGYRKIFLFRTNVTNTKNTFDKYENIYLTNMKIFSEWCVMVVGRVRTGGSATHAAHHNLDLGPGPRQNVYNGQVLKHSSVQVPKHSNVQVLKHSDVQVLKHSRVQVPKDPNVQVLNHTNIQKFKWTNWKEIM